MLNIFLALCLLVTVNGVCNSNMNEIEGVAKRDSQGRNPDGRCYSHVADYIDATGFGGIDKNGFNDAIPPAYWAEARQFAEYLNQGSNAADLCIKNVQGQYSNNPYKAPTGSIVVVRAGTPGTAHPTAGDIAIVGGGDYFWNGGEMSYGGSGNFPPSNNYVLGIYVPTECVGHCDGGGGDSDDGGSGCPKSCQDCVKNGGGKSCGDRCTSCSKDCQDCIKNGGGTGCSSRCAPTVSSHYLFSALPADTNTTLVQGRTVESEGRADRTVQSEGRVYTSTVQSEGRADRTVQSEPVSFPGISHYRSYIPSVSGSTCTGPHEFCCEAPGDPKETCPASAYTSDCAAKGACCCA
jgi:hypothetical protein